MSVAKTIEMPHQAEGRKVWLPDDEAEQALARQHELGQFLTPDPVADFMASLFRLRRSSIHLLDAGAGDGALTAALVRRLCRDPHKAREIAVTAYELDEKLLERLRGTLSACRAACDASGIEFSATIHNGDFIEALVPVVRHGLFAPQPPQFTTTTANPSAARINFGAASSSDGKWSSC